MVAWRSGVGALVVDDMARRRGVSLTASINCANAPRVELKTCCKNKSWIGEGSMRGCGGCIMEVVGNRNDGGRGGRCEVYTMRAPAKPSPSDAPRLSGRTPDPSATLLFRTNRLQNPIWMRRDYVPACRGSVAELAHLVNDLACLQDTCTGGLRSRTRANTRDTFIQSNYNPHLSVRLSMFDASCCNSCISSPSSSPSHDHVSSIRSAAPCQDAVEVQSHTVLFSPLF